MRWSILLKLFSNNASADNIHECLHGEAVSVTKDLKYLILEVTGVNMALNMLY